MYCKYCGKKLKDGKNYCDICKKYQNKQSSSFNFFKCFGIWCVIDIIFLISWGWFSYMTTSCDAQFGCLDKSLSVLIPFLFFLPSLVVVLILTGLCCLLNKL